MKASSGSVQKSKKASGSGNTAGAMADAYAGQSVDTTRQQEMIAVAAYFRAEQRGFAPGNELEDWFQAESAYQTYSKQNPG